MLVCVVVVVVVVAIIKLYVVQMGRFLAGTSYVAPSTTHETNRKIYNVPSYYVSEVPIQTQPWKSNQEQAP